ncbi:MAG TPA: efflux RND transporter periplasmic adaptor subunit, partial [Prolixibacteraceae bacterium]|nr:efflux RND transporter periplasmic adaptor subunit [Prolixibacteraceae bacterium]
RISKLVEEQITARKELTSAENNFKIAKAEKESIEAILKLMHLDPNQVEKGNIKANYKMPSPISGYITKMNINNGQYIEPQHNALNIVDNSKLQLILNVFEKDINNLSKGQTVLFYDPDRKSDKQKATISSIGRSINPQTKTIPCIAQIEKTEEDIFINGMYAECEVITETKETNTLPLNAIINENDSDFVLVKTREENDALVFNKVKVETGLTSSGHIEIKTEGLKNVLVKGSYYYQN